MTQPTHIAILPLAELQSSKIVSAKGDRPSYAQFTIRTAITPELIAALPFLADCHARDYPIDVTITRVQAQLPADRPTELQRLS
jgi:hypothetical protein